MAALKMKFNEFDQVKVKKQEVFIIRIKIATV